VSLFSKHTFFIVATTCTEKNYTKPEVSKNKKV
jgi:hypothetical protein